MVTTIMWEEQVKKAFSFVGLKGILELSWWCKSKKELPIAMWPWGLSQLRKNSIISSKCVSEQESCRMGKYHKWNDQWHLNHRNPGEEPKSVEGK